ncbi:MAG: PAS domain S-box protein [Bacteroidia bacterium]
MGDSAKKNDRISRHRSLTLGGSVTALRIALFFVSTAGLGVGYFLKTYYPRILLAEQIYLPAIVFPAVVGLASFVSGHIRRRLIDYSFISFVLIYLLVIFLSFHNHLGTYFVATLIAAQILLNISFRKIPEFLLVATASLILFSVLAFTFENLEIHPNLFLSVMGFATIGSGIFVWLNQVQEIQPEPEATPQKIQRKPRQETTQPVPPEKDAQEKLTQPRDVTLYQELFHISGDGLVLLTPGGHAVVSINETALRMLNVAQTDVVGQKLEQILLPENVEKITPLLTGALEGKVLFTELELQTKNAGSRQIWAKARMIILAEDFHLLLTLRDIDREMAATLERTKADKAFQEEVLRQSEQKYRTLVERMNEGLILSDNYETILFVNNRLCEILGMKREELIGKRTYEILPGENARKVIEHKALLRRQGVSDQYELQTTRADGEAIWLLIAGTPYVDSNEDMIGTIAILTDISDRKITEIKLQEKNNELDAFVYKASHDLKGPLASIIGVTNIAREEVSDTAAHRYFDLITKSAQRLDGILSELLDLTRINKASLVAEPVDIAALTDEIIHSLRHLPQSEQVDFLTDIQMPEPFATDRKMLVSILQNLIVNAVNYQNTGEEKPYVKITAFLRHERAVIQVEDNGVGIPEKIQHRVFEMFYRGNTRSKGSGLGLYLVKSALEKLRGTIELQSEAGKGSVFTISIPPPGDNFSSG